MPDSLAPVTSDPPPRADAAAGDERPGVSAYAVFSTNVRKRSRGWWQAHLATLMFGGTLLFTALVAATVYAAFHATDRARFANAVQSTSARVTSRIATYVALLHGTRGLFAASDDVSADEFRRYVAQLALAEEFTGVRGIGYSRWLNPPGAPSDPRSLAAELHRGGSPAVALDPPGTRAEYHAIVYLEPRDDRNDAALGFDMHTEPTRRAAMDAARDRGGVAASGIVQLRQEIDADRQHGFLLYVPVYEDGLTPTDTASRRRALRGFVYAAFRVGELFAGIFGPEQWPRIAFRVFDGPDTTATSLIYASPNAPGIDASVPPVALTVLDTVVVADRRWTFVYTPLPAAGDGVDTAIAVGAIATFGVLVALLLFRVTRAEIRARELAERSDMLRGRFFAAMSHELRTPINAVLGYNELLLTGVYGPLAASQEHGVRRSQRATRHLLELINDVLDLSKLEAGKMDVVVESVRVDELLDDLLVTIRPMAQERGCDVRLERESCACTIDTDPRRLRQIVLNLLSNATKFGAGKPVVVHCTYLPHGAPLPGVGGRSERRRTAGDAVVIAVTDQGPGIAQADQERIFEEFVQLPGSTSGGTGLGLPISRRLAELLGGHLTLRSLPGRGSSFSVTIPRRNARDAHSVRLS